MKLAVVISGEPRQYDLTYKSINKFFEGFDVDFYIHSWDDTTTPCNNSRPNDDTYFEPNAHIDYDKSKLKDELNSMYNPKRLKVESKDVLDEEIKKYKIPYGLLDYIKVSNFGCISQFYSAQTAYKLIDKNTTYNLIFKMRFDLIMRGSVSVHVKLLSNRKETILFPKIKVKKGLLNPTFPYAYGHVQPMNSLWGNILQEACALETERFTHAHLNNGHTMIGRLILRKKLSIESIPEAKHNFILSRYTLEKSDMEEYDNESGEALRKIAQKSHKCMKELKELKKEKRKSKDDE